MKGFRRFLSKAPLTAQQPTAAYPMESKVPKASKQRSHDVLILEDNSQLREALHAAFSMRDRTWVRATANLAAFKAAATDRLPNLVILDLELPYGDAFDALHFLAPPAPTPVIVGISGVARPDASFRLAQAGVSEFVSKPLEIAALERAVERASTKVPNLEPHLRASVGRVPLARLEELVRSTMVNEALSRSSGNRRGAARQLAVSRQLLQHMSRKLT